MGETIERWMSRDPATLGAADSALAAHELMLGRGIRHLPVVADGQRVIGVLSCDDLRAALALEAGFRAPLPVAARSEAREWCVGDLMTHLPETLGPGDSLEAAALRMAERRIGCLPIVDARGRLVGILSETDLLRALATRLAGERPAGAHGARTLVDELQRERDAVARELARSADEDRRRSEERRAPGDLAEHAALRSDEQFAESLESIRARRLAALDHALRRAAEGHFGRCEGCGGEIPVPRLRALPGSTQCIACARRAEGGAPAGPR